MTTQYQNQSVQYSDTIGNTATLTPNIGLVLSNGVTNLTMDQTGFTNGVQSLLFSDLYAGVEKTKAIKFLTSTPTTLSVVDTIEVVDDNITPNYKSEIIPTSLTITELSSGNYASLGYNGFTIVNTINSESNTIDQNSITLSAPDTFNQVIISNDISVSDPFIRMDDSLGRPTIYSNVSTTADSGYCYTLNNGTRFMKQQNPFSFRQYELTSGQNIEVYMPFVFIQGGGNIQFQSVSNYLDDAGEAGWSCIVSNYSGGTLQIDIADASSWYSHSSGGGQGNPINLKKWETCRITLVYSSIDNQYIYAVSEY